MDKIEELDNKVEVVETVEEVKVKRKYTQAHKDAQQRYRDKYPERYCKQQRDLYDKLKSNEEWKLKFNERCKVNNALQRERKKQELMLDPNYVQPKRGRPRNK